MPKVLFIAAHRPNRSPSQRFRYEQYISFLEENGYECDMSWIVSEKDDAKLYTKGNYFTKLKLFGKGIAKRWQDVINANNYDVIFLQREAFMTGSAFFEKRLSKKRPKLIFDFDDAIWLLDVSEGNKKLAWLKNPNKTGKIISMADVVVCGNNFLADYAKTYNKNVSIIPTTLDTTYHKPIPERRDIERVIIGWTGAATTLKHFKLAAPALKILKEKYKDKIQFLVIADEPPKEIDLEIIFSPWDIDTEIDDLNKIDIGIMPLPNTEWAKGKCGFKALQYMACEIPAVVSPIGMNKEIVTDGKNGYIANSTEEWVEKLSDLIDSKELRKQIGKKGRETVEAHYSVNANKGEYLYLFNAVIAG